MVEHERTVVRVVVDDERRGTSAVHVDRVRASFAQQDVGQVGARRALAVTRLAPIYHKDHKRLPVP